MKYNLGKRFRTPFSFLKEKSKAIMYLLSIIEQRLLSDFPSEAESIKRIFRRLYSTLRAYSRGKGKSPGIEWEHIKAAADNSQIAIDRCIRCLENDFSLEGIETVLDILPLGPDCCPFCLSKVSCSECGYATLHKRCGEANSSITKLYEALGDLKGKIHNLKQKGGKNEKDKREEIYQGHSQV